jgi:DNA-binding transcriptional LysR family regulator
MVYISFMRQVNLNGIDLNLLPPLDALLRHRSVTRAAVDVGMSQPAMSRALGRMRESFGDPLLVRGSGGLVLTPTAEALLPVLRQALVGVLTVFQTSALDPLTAERTVRIAASDVQTVLIGPPLFTALAQAAPAITLQFQPYGRDLIERIEDGRSDFAFALTTSPLPPGAISFPVARDRLALVMRKHHPLEVHNLTLCDYGHLPHVAISLLDDGISDLDAALAVKGVTRRIALRTPHFLSALAIVGGSDAVTTVSRSLAQKFADRFGLVLRDPPIDDLVLTMVLVTSHIKARDPLLVWIAEQIRQTAQSVFAPMPR